jgi:cyclopropane fatty-acyl-phospholipid synthase-like methyltransferase
MIDFPYKDMLRHVEETFDLIAESYVALEDTETCRNFSRQMIDLLGDLKGKEVLDAGCGFGQQAILMLESGAMVTGVDISRKLLDVARERTIHFEHGIFIKIDIMEYLASIVGRYDAIISFFELMFHKNVSEILKAFNSALRPGGQLLLLVAHPVRNMGMHRPPKYFEEGLHQEKWKVGKVFKYYHTLSDYINSVVSNGFQIVQMIEPIAPKDKMTFYDVDISFQNGTQYPQALVILCRKCWVKND